MSHAVVRRELLVLAAQHRPSGYLETVLAAGVDDGTFVRIPRERYLELVKDFAVHGPTPAYPHDSKHGVTLLQKAKNFAAASAKHLAAGAPMATDDEVARRFAICQGCEHFDGKACRQCGCPVVRERKYLSKLSWADSSCPVGKWGPVTG